MNCRAPHTFEPYSGDALEVSQQRLPRRGGQDPSGTTLLAWVAIYAVHGVYRGRKLFIASLAAVVALLALSASSFASGGLASINTESTHQLTYNAQTWVSWGSDVGGVLGAGYASFTPALTPVGVLVTAPKELVTGHAALMQDGTVRAWGGNSAGQIGDGTRERKLNPIAVPA
jgi:hypothetical protein